MNRLVKMLFVLQVLTICSLFMQSCSRPAYAWGNPSIGDSAARIANALEHIANVLENRR